MEMYGRWGRMDLRTLAALGVNLVESDYLGNVSMENENTGGA